MEIEQTNPTILASDLVEYTDLNEELNEEVSEYLDDISAYNESLDIKEEVQNVLVSLENMSVDDTIRPFILSEANNYYLTVCDQLGTTPSNISTESNSVDITLTIENFKDILNKIIDGIKKLLEKIIINIKKLYIKLLTVINNDEKVIKMLISEINNKTVNIDKDKLIVDLQTLFSSSEDVKQRLYKKISGIALVSDISSKNILEVIELYSKHIMDKQAIDPAPSNFKSLNNMIRVQNMYKFIPNGLININIYPKLHVFDKGTTSYCIVNANENSLGILSICNVKEHVIDVKYSRHKLHGLISTKSNYNNPYHKITRFTDFYVGSKDFKLTDILKIADIVHTNSGIIKTLYTTMNSNIKSLNTTTETIQHVISSDDTTPELKEELGTIQKITTIVPHVYVDDMLSILKLNKVLINIVKIVNQNIK